MVRQCDVPPGSADARWKPAARVHVSAPQLARVVVGVSQPSVAVALQSEWPASHEATTQAPLAHDHPADALPLQIRGNAATGGFDFR